MGIEEDEEKAEGIEGEESSRDISMEGRVRGPEVASDLPLPVLAEDQEGLRQLRQQQQEDGSLTS